MKKFHCLSSFLSFSCSLYSLTFILFVLAPQLVRCHSRLSPNTILRMLCRMFLVFLHTVKIALSKCHAGLDHCHSNSYWFSLTFLTTSPQTCYSPASSAFLPNVPSSPLPISHRSAPYLSPFISYCSTTIREMLHLNKTSQDQGNWFDIEWFFIVFCLKLWSSCCLSASQVIGYGRTLAELLITVQGCSNTPTVLISWTTPNTQEIHMAEEDWSELKSPR